jgi:hypothetical protein
MAEHWSREEVEAVVADYLDMLLKERRGEEVNKTAHNQNLRNTLIKRSKGSVEFKHQNISAILQDIGYPWIEGYKPRMNFQDLLREIVAERLAEFPLLDAVIAQQVTADVPSAPLITDVLSIVVPRPEVRMEDVRSPNSIPQRRARKPNYLEIEARNRSLGRAGEELVVRFEQERLWRSGQKKLSDRVEHVSSTQGDGLGFDVLSFEEDGRERWIEVKTTQFGAMTPFFASRLEVDVSVEYSRQFQLYRLFQFKATPRMFTLPGSLTESCKLQPQVFKAALK